MSGPVKASKPESLRQAITWDANKREALRVGCCDRCAGQTAWARQLGATVVESEPCDDCRVLLLSLGPVLSDRVQRWARKGLSANLMTGAGIPGVVAAGDGHSVAEMAA